jgi:uncharacterized protein YprB with RNaseH-like and TPR domain
MLQHPGCFPSTEKVGFLDIETDGLDGGDYNMIYSWAIKALNGKVVYDVVTVEEMDTLMPDKRILKHLMQELRNYDVIVTWFGARFDIRMVLARLFRLGLEDLWPDPQTIRHIDLYDTSRKLLMAHRRLNNVEELLYDTSDKTRMTFKIHDALRARKVWAFKWVVEHNIVDVKSTENNWLRLRKFAPVTRRWL